MTQPTPDTVISTVGDATVFETAISDSDIERVFDLPTAPEPDDVPTYSKAILKTVEEMRTGSIANNDKRSRKIVSRLRADQKKMDRAKKAAAKKTTAKKKTAAKKPVKKTKKVAKPRIPAVQHTISEFGGK